VRQVCVICGAPAKGRRFGDGPYCDLHYQRARVGADLHAVRPRGRPPLDTTTDYMDLSTPVSTQEPVKYPDLVGHPLAHIQTVKGRRVWALTRARYVLYQRIGEGPHRCHWCGRPVNWNLPRPDELTVDHVNFDKRDDSLQNLVPSCALCNSYRHPRRYVNETVFRMERRVKVLRRRSMVSAG
jgi:hypothetical protein